MSYDPTTTTGQIRLLIGDTQPDDFLFTDTEITAFYTMALNNIYGAAGVAFGVIIRTKSLLAKKVSREGYTDEEHAVKDMLLLKKDVEQQANTVAGVATSDFAQLDDEHFVVWRPTWRDISHTDIVE